MEYFTFYNITYFLCFSLWMYFDQMSSTIVNLKVVNISDNDMDAGFFKNPKQMFLIKHIVLKTFFYLSLILLLFQVGWFLFFASLIASIIGVKIFSSTSVIENIVASEKFKNAENNFDNKKLLKYINIAYCSNLLFVISIFLF